jgi:tRNA-dihydrouridine synthase
MERDSERVCDILTALRRHLPRDIVVSAKIRLPSEDDVLKDRIARLLDTGIHFLTVHGRTLKENKTNVGAVHVDRIKLAIETAHTISPNFPVIANGGMETYHDIQSILQYTGASAAMSSEALLETPNLFQSSSSMYMSLPRDRFDQQIFFATRYLDICQEVGPPLPGVMGDGGSFSIVRGHLFKFLHRYLNNDHTDLRDRFAASSEKMRTLHDARSLIRQLKQRYAGLSDDEWVALASSNPEASWYRRHRRPDRRVHHRLIPGGGGGGGRNNKLSSLDIDARKREIKDRIAKMKERNQRSREETHFVPKVM